MKKLLCYKVKSNQIYTCYIIVIEYKFLTYK
jgi:hypothetical protein